MITQSEFFKAKLENETDPSDLKETLDNSNELIIVDARSSVAFEQEHIPNAISLPHRTMNAESTAHLDKSKIYVSYCDGIGCNASTKGAYKLAQLGFRVRELIGGLEWWKREGFETHGIKAGVNSNL